MGSIEAPAIGTAEPGFASGFDEHRRQQILRVLALTPAERLRWLQKTNKALRRLKVRARPTAQTQED